MDRLEAWTIFVAVAERGSFADAARHLGRSPAAVTRAVAALEHHLSTRLLNRTTRSVALTDAGARYLRRLPTHPLGIRGTGGCGDRGAAATARPAQCDRSRHVRAPARATDRSRFSRQVSRSGCPPAAARPRGIADRRRARCGRPAGPPARFLAAG